MLLTKSLSHPTTTFDQLAVQDFMQAARQALWRDWLSWLTRKNNNLLPFDQIRQHLSFKGQQDRGLYAVPLDKIVGSVNRYRDFDRAFFPRQTRTRERWLNIDRAYYNDIALPPADLLKVGEMYFVSDGHHRVSVARARGQEYIDASVTEIDTIEPIETVQSVTLAQPASSGFYTLFVERFLVRFKPRSRCAGLV